MDKQKMQNDIKIYDELLNIAKNNNFPTGPSEININKEYKLSNIDFINLWQEYNSMNDNLKVYTITECPHFNDHFQLYRFI